MEKSSITEIAKKIIAYGFSGKSTDIVLSVGQRPYILDKDNHVTFLSDEPLMPSDVKSLENCINRFQKENVANITLDVIHEKEAPITKGVWEDADKEHAVATVFRRISSIDGIGEEITKKILSCLGNDTFDSFHISYRTRTGALIPLYQEDFSQFID